MTTKVNIIQESETVKGRVYLYKSGIIHQVYDDNADLVMNDSLKEIEIYTREFCTENKRPILVDITNIRSVDKGARGIYTSNKAASIISKAALLVGNPVSRIIGNFYLGLNKTHFPVKMFTSENDALEWLSQPEVIK